jgi:hypothetical protein
MLLLEMRKIFLDPVDWNDAALGEKKMDGGLKTFGLDCATSPSGFT